MDRRNFLRAGATMGAATVGGRWLIGCTVPTTPPGSTTTTAAPTTTVAPAPGFGTLNAADANGVMLPSGFTSRIVATSGSPVGSTGYTWHRDPDGGACFPAPGGGWIYANNSETAAAGGGASMIRFDTSGSIVEARSILAGTTRNCAGGATPWMTWLSCEETATGQVWECDPRGIDSAVARPAMGRFNHEAAVIDPNGGVAYLTEDQPDGALYRFVPTSYPDLAAGALQVLTETAGVLGWSPVPDPSAATTATRYQVANTKRFNGGEGICLSLGAVVFTTKGDNRVWRYDPVANTIAVQYDLATTTTPVLSGVDNVTASANGELYVAEDGGDMQIVHVIGDQAAAVVQVSGVAGSEITGPAFSPDGTRLYFNSQRNPGRTYEVTGPWRQS